MNRSVFEGDYNDFLFSICTYASVTLLYTYSDLCPLINDNIFHVICTNHKLPNSDDFRFYQAAR